MSNIHTLLEQLGWRIVHREKRPGREPRYTAVPMWLPKPIHEEVQRRFDGRLFQHQVEALEAHHQGRHVAMTTSTASGKSLVFYLAALAALHRDAEARIAALYPMKALIREQTQRWKGWLQSVGLPAEWVRRIDGDVDTRAREAILREARVVLFTPDVVHAWLLPNSDKPFVIEFLKQLRLLIVDEVHTYSGVFGSNAAYLFRRWQHLMHLVGNTTSRWIVSSATLRDASHHLSQLFGLDFEIIDESRDTSPQHELELLLVQPPAESDRFSSLARLLHELVQQTEHRFLAFADSRKQVEFLSTLVRRLRPRAVRTEAETEAESDEDTALWRHRVREVLEQEDILPYRAGLEFTDRALIQKRLSDGSLRGVISTSALELGIDIGHLDVAILIGVPPTMTNLQQRIGRIGRKGPGYVLVVNTGTPQDEALFRRPQRALHRPPAESTLYLENRYLQYIHALCLARPEEGEHDRLTRALGAMPRNDAFHSPIPWPRGFVELCQEERTGQVSRELQNWAHSVQNQPPQWVYPLRDIEPQFQVELRRRGQREERGTLSFYQVLNEAYPGAVYYYAGIPYRVVRVYQRSRRVEVIPEKQYLTRPRKYPWLRPSLRPESIFQAYAWDDLLILETELSIRERVTGYEEWRGGNKIEVSYPNHYWDLHYFERGYFSTALIFTHPALNEYTGSIQQLAERLYEAFLLTVPVERQEIGWGTGRMPIAQEPFFRKEQRFIALYERTYGGLRLTGRLLENLPQRLLAMLDTMAQFRDINGAAAILAQWRALIQNTSAQRVHMDTLLDQPRSGQEDRVRIIVPGSRAYIVRDGQHVDVRIQDVFYHRTKGPMYKAVTCKIFLYEPPERNSESRFLIEEVYPIPGISCLGWYDLERDEVIPDEAQDCRADDDCWTPDA